MATAEQVGDTVSERLAGFALDLRYEAMSGADIAAIKRLILDTVGCALGAVGCEPVEMLTPLLRAPTETQDQATLIGNDRQVSLADAILHNGALVRYLDFMDVYWARDICHPSENIPVALAAAEAAHSCGRALIEAIAVAYEAQVRLADACCLESVGLHHVSAAGFVTPLVFGKLWGLNAAQLAHAVALGGFRHLTSAALVQGRLSMAKAIGYAVAASECVTSTRLAAAGFTGPRRVLEGLGVQAFDFTAGTSCATRVSLKQFPIQYSLQSPVEAALQLRKQAGDRTQEIVSLEIEVPPDVCKRTADAAKFRPANRETADHSLPCCVALALLDGELSTAQFDNGRWQSAEVGALVAKMRCTPSPELEKRFPGGRPARLSIGLTDGRQLSALVERPLGDAQRPMDDAQLQTKFIHLASPVIGPRAAGRVIDMVMDLEKLADVSPLCALLGDTRSNRSDKRHVRGEPS